MNDFELQLGDPEPVDDGLAPVVWKVVAPRPVVLNPVRAAIVAHTREDTTLECGGVMLGSVDGETGDVVVSAALRADGASRQADSLRFTHEVINDIHERRQERHPDLHIVGWYHSHPGYGVFLSADDLFMHRHFFAAPFHLALVLDPVAKKGGIFGWVDGEIKRVPLLSRVEAATDVTTRPSDVDDGMASRRKWLRVVPWVLVAVVAFVLGFTAGRVAFADGDPSGDLTGVRTLTDVPSGGPSSVKTGDAGPAPR